MSLHEDAWIIATMVSRKDSKEIKLVYDHRVPYPNVEYLGRPVNRYVLHIPTVEKLVPDGFGLSPLEVVRLRVFRACVAHEACHTYLTNPHIYENPQITKIPLAKFVSNIVEDYRVENFLVSKWSGIGRDIVFANAVSYLRFRPLDSSTSQIRRLVLASVMKAFCGEVKGRMRDEERVVVDEVYEILQAVKWSSEGSYLVDSVKRICDLFYTLNTSSGSPFLVLPHQDGRTFVSRYFSNRISGDDLSAALEIVSEHVGLKKEFILSNNDDFNEADHIFQRERFVRETEEKILEDLKSVPTKFRYIGYCAKDYAEYLNLKADLTPIFKSIENQISMVVTEEAEVSRQVSGIVDMTEAVQVVASESYRTDVFSRWMTAEKGDAWAVLVDSSRSMMRREETLRQVAIIFAEVLNKLRPHNQWALYTFSDFFHIVKDFKEKYSKDVAARLGGLVCGGATYMPDAINLVQRRIFRNPVSFKVLVVVSDGQPYGYPEIEKKSKEAVRKAEMSGLTTIGIGIRHDGIKDYIRTWCKINKIRELAREFMRQYFAVTGQL